MFIRVDDVTYVEVQFSHSKLYKFISSWKVDKNSMKLYRFFFKKLTKKYKENEGWNILKFRAYTVIYAGFKTL